jgi:hypothetical protein
MSNQQSLRDTDPKNLDMGEVIDFRTGELLAEATAWEAAASLKALRATGGDSGTIYYVTINADRILARVVPREGTSMEDYRLAVALKLRWEREMLSYVEEVERRAMIKRSRHNIPSPWLLSRGQEDDAK